MNRLTRLLATAAVASFAVSSVAATGPAFAANDGAMKKEEKMMKKEEMKSEKMMKKDDKMMKKEEMSKDAMMKKDEMKKEMKK